MKSGWRRHRGVGHQEPDFDCGHVFEQFSVGSKDSGETWDVFEWLSPEQTQVICTASSEDYATFLAAAANTCKNFSPCRELD